MTPARLAAARVLIAIERGRTTLADELARGHRGLADPRDRALLVELASGVLRSRAAIDAAIGAHSRRAMATLSPEVRAALRLGVYQLDYLTRVPARAGVHESVELVRALGQPRAAGFVNAVLRRAAERRGHRKLPAKPDATADRARQLAYLSLTCSHPEWLAARWLDRYGFDAAAAWCEFNARPPDLSLRVRPPATLDTLRAALSTAGVIATPGRWVSTSLTVPAGSLGGLPDPIRAMFDIQDEASQLVAHAVGVVPGDRVLDVCAAPGGKTLVMAHALGGRGTIVAADHRPRRVRLLRDVITQAGARVPIVALDARRPLPFSEAFDRVLLDAPCSGLGTLRRDPDVKWARREADLARFAAEQRRMIEQAAGAVRPGGRLVYATCSSEPEENEAVVEHFLASRPDFAVEPPHGPTAAPRLASLVGEHGWLRTLPFRDGLDAYFAAVLVRRELA
jgi:16S rRNA (cytosine967-C5)-methyltransferase